MIEIMIERVDYQNTGLDGDTVHITHLKPLKDSKTVINPLYKCTSFLLSQNQYFDTSLSTFDS